jgi:hypothetical protein
MQYVGILWQAGLSVLDVQIFPQPVLELPVIHVYRGTAIACKY